MSTNKSLSTLPPSSAASQSGYFDALFTDWPALKIAGIALFIIAQTIGNALRLGVIWYVNCGGGARTLINKLIAAFCTILVVANLTLANAILITHLIGHYGLPTIFCRTLVFSANFAIANLLLFENTVTFLRAMYIFKWKIVGKRDNNLTAFIVTCLLVFFGFCFALTLHWLDFENNCIHYYVCLNQRPPNNLFEETKPIISFWLLCGLLGTSLLLHTSVFARIHVYNSRKLNKDSLNQLHITEALMQQKRKINTDLCTSMIGITLSSLCALPLLIGLRFFSSEQVLEVGSVANFCLYAVHFGVHFMLAVPMTIAYYVNNEGLTTAVIRRVGQAFNSRRMLDAISRNDSFVQGIRVSMTAETQEKASNNEEQIEFLSNPR